MTSEAPDLLPAIDGVAGMLNDLGGQVLAHAPQLQHLTSAQQNTPAGNAAGHAKNLRGWVVALVDEYGLHAQIGPPDRQVPSPADSAEYA